MKKVLSILICIATLLCSLPVFSFAEGSTSAHWKLDKFHLKDGRETGDYVFEDCSGNGNDLLVAGENKYLTFEGDTMYPGAGGSLLFNNEKQRILGKGNELITAENAPINKESFENGYTIELIYKLPDDFSADDSWMGLMARKGESSIETKKCTMSLAVSNCKELQFMTAGVNGDILPDSAWSVTMDKGGVWYHIAVVSDGKAVRTFVNGCESFRNVESETNGIFADPEDGRFVIGGYSNGLFNHYARGAFQEVRISNKPLARSEWLVKDHEKYIEKFGENLPFQNLSRSSYNVVFLPDIQNAVEFRPEVLKTAAKWLCDNRDLVNAKAFISLGDSTNDYDDTVQWGNALNFYNELYKGGYKILQQPGNHDYGDNYYLDAFGPESDFGKKTGNTFSPSGYSSYITFDGGSYKYLAVNISMFHISDASEREWLQSVLTEYKDYPTIVTSHSFQDVDAAKPNAVTMNDFGKSVWDIVKKHSQVFMMISGHNHGAGAEVLLNDAGLDVYSVMTDYQFTYNGGNAFFRFAEFDEAHNKIRLSSFSPYSATLRDDDRTFFDVNYMTGDGSYTVIDFKFESRFEGLKKSEDAEYAKILKTAKETEKDAPFSHFENIDAISRSDGKTVSSASVLSPLWICVIVISSAIILALLITAAVLLIKKKRRFYI